MPPLTLRGAELWEMEAIYCDMCREWCDCEWCSVARVPKQYRRIGDTLAAEIEVQRCMCFACFQQRGGTYNEYPNKYGR